MLRSGRYDEAFADLRLAAQADTGLRPQLFRLALEIYGSDINGLKLALGENPAARADFAIYLLQQKRTEDGLLMWNTLSEADKKANINAANSIIASLVSVHRYHDAMKIWNGIAPTDLLKTDLGRVIDGGFEETITHSKETAFGWQTSSAPQMQIGIDPQMAHSGMRSLRLVFQVRAKLDSLQAYTLVPVAPATEYEFECYVRTEKLQGGDTPYVEIVNATDGASLATSSQAPNGDTDWTRLALSFKTGDKAEAVKIQLARVSCEKDKICPLFGAVWYDDFSLKRRD